jgi:O-antigen/teichoic acid export membrane protein
MRDPMTASRRHDRFLIAASIQTLVLRASGMAASFALGILLARLLKPDGLGIYGVAISLSLTMAAFAQAGLPTLAIREMAVALERRDWSSLRGAAAWTMANVAALGLVLGLGLALSVLLFPGLYGADTTAILIAAAMIAPLALTTLIGAQLRAIGRLLGGQALEILVRPAATLAICLAVAAGIGGLGPLQGLQANLVASVGALSLGVFWLIRALPGETREASSTYRHAGWFKAAVPLAVVDAARQLDANYGILVLGALAANQDAGLFRVAMSIIVFLATPLSVAHVVLGPLLARLHDSGHRSELRRLMALAALAMTGAMLGAFLLIYFAGEWLLIAIFGGEYGSSWLPLIMLTAAQLVNGCFGVGWVLLTMSGGERALSRSFLISVPVSVAIAVVLVPALGAVGAAWAAIAGAIVQNLIVWIAVRRIHAIDCSIFGALALSRGASAGER